ncbi:hypothetical protein Agub_g4887 [Astrephomene gubernaculifera]|uniref:Uncharacterized protein n=1 Tax=Astrephomene gubernaculifera TaxID=47775 RepID=A0AAD3HK97_9CHLO|nr:hypothetical protein Agub_g4887 [Astrephomene gubernaculifera]
MPNTPSAGAVERANASYSELCRRPLRRHASGPAQDAAGAVTGQKGDKNPLRGRGNPPAEEKEWQFQSSKHFVPGKSFAPSLTGVLERRAGSSGPATGNSVRTELRLSPRSYQSHLAGSAVSVTSEANVAKPMRRPGSGTPRTQRVLGVAADADEPVQTTFALFGSSSRQGKYGFTRPTTAPALFLRTKAQTRVGYETGRSAHGDVLNYRHSGGICPPQHKLVTERPAAPQLTAPASEQARSGFFDARTSYQVNKLRSQRSDILAMD